MTEPGFLRSFFAKKPHDEPEAADVAEVVVETPAPAAAPAPAVVLTDDQRDRDLELAIVEVLQSIYDPEIPVNIYELGLIYSLTADLDGNVKIVMTLTTPHCPVAESLPGEIEMKVREVERVRDADVEVTWDPPWDQTMMSEAARLELGFL